MDWIFELLSKVYFEQSVRLKFLSVVPVLFFLWLITWLLRFLFKPLRTYGSRYPLIGSLRLWLFLILALPFIIGAWAKPFVTGGNVIAVKGNAEVIFIVDHSVSMFLKDTGLARLDIARRELEKLVSRKIIKDGDRVSLFLLQAFGLPPRLYLTEDLEGFSNEISRISRPSTLHFSNYFGSDVSGMFEKLYQSIDRQDFYNEFNLLEISEGWRPKFKRNRLIIILSDGDFFNDPNMDVNYHKNRLVNALEELKKRGVTVYPIGIGTMTETSLLEILKDYERYRQYDLQLEVDLGGISSRLHPESLETLSNVTGGMGPFIIQGVNGDASGFIESVINRHRSVNLETSLSQDKKDLWPHFLLIASVMFTAGLGFYPLVALALIITGWWLYF